MRLALALATLALALPLVVSAGASGADGITSFRTPSKNIYCAREKLGRTDMLRCDVRKLAHKAPKPRGCKFGYGNSFGVNAHGRARALCVSDSVIDLRAAVLAYGTKRHFGPFTCTSKTSGLRCSNRSGHGFALNRTRYKLF
jgi:Family of unknown function (DUF6636)